MSGAIKSPGTLREITLTFGGGEYGTARLVLVFTT